MQTIHILNEQHSIANRYLFELRDISLQTDRMRFRKNLERLGSLMAFELSKTLRFKESTANTPLGKSHIQLPKDEVILVTVLRAGLPFFQGFSEIFDREGSGFIGAYRGKHEGSEFEIELNYAAAPSLEGKTLLLIDTMLATGKSLVKTLDALSKFGRPASLHIASVIAAPEGVEYLKNYIQSDHHLWIWALDEKLNDHAYIVPGLGDAGDLSFGPKE